MSFSRFSALDLILNRTGYDLEYVDQPSETISNYFGCNVFGDAPMKEYLDETT